MDDKILDALDLNQSKFEENKIDSTQRGKVICGFVDKCQNFNDVETLVLRCIEDKSGPGILFAKEAVEKALVLRKSGKIGPIDRNGKAVSETIELLILANSFAKFCQPNDKETYLSLFNKAHVAAVGSFDFRMLAGSLYDACRNIEDTTIDPDFALTKELAKKAADLSLDENSLLGIEDMASMAKNQLNDKDLAKYVAALKKKIKK
jgi:hypothetical protein